MTKKDLDKLSKFVKTVMSYKPAKDQITEKEQAKPDFNSKFVWQEGDLVIEESPRKPVEVKAKKK